ncbi:transposase [Mycobacterium kyorinense]|uniref:Transposase n=1 Tax=Mycobacterium kyorinense TaxID=487514 RepID=A0A1A2Z782_9MYCO|nr:transposase [Mycobacterium kyorinense]
MTPRFEIPTGWTAQAYRFALDPSPAQLPMLESHCGAARFAFNHMLGMVKANLDQRSAERSYGIAELELTPAQGWSLAKLRKAWNQRKEGVAPWWPANSKEAYNTGLDALARALEAWDKSRAGERAGARVGFPRFKAKHAAGRSVRFTTGAIRVASDRHHVVLPRLGCIRTHESTRKLARRLEAGAARILSATVSRQAGRWFCSFQVIVANKGRPANIAKSPHAVVGIDVGVRDLLVVATPEGVEVDRIPAPKPLQAAQARLHALQRRAARQQGPYDATNRIRREPSNRWQRTQRRIAKAHARAASVRAHEMHLVTTTLAARHDVVVCEHLNAAAMRRRGGVRKRGLNRALADAALGRVRAQLAYKTLWYGTTLVVASRLFESTQLCSRCGAKTKLRLRDRRYRCRNGCPAMDRDLNAAINLARLSETTTAGGRMRTGTGSSPAASVTAGEGRRANQKTSPTVPVGTARGDDTSTPRTTKAGTAAPQGEAA